MAPTQYDKKPKPGDLIEIYRIGYQHWAIYIGDGLVIHLTSEGSQVGCCSAVSVATNIAIVKMEKLQDVVGKNKYCINNHLDDERDPRPISVIIKDAKSLVGTTHPYCVLTSNCEHFVTELRYGKPKSRQVQAAVETGGVIAALGGIAAVFGVIVSSLVRSKN